MSYQLQVYLKVNKDGEELETYEKVSIEAEQLDWKTADQVVGYARDLYIRAAGGWNGEPLTWQPVLSET